VALAAGASPITYYIHLISYYVQNFSLVFVAANRREIQVDTSKRTAIFGSMFPVNSFATYHTHKMPGKNLCHAPFSATNHWHFGATLLPNIRREE
jgi:hypothetical protein